MATQSDVVKAAQGILKLADPALMADGWWGSFTNTIYLKASVPVKGAVDMTLKGYGLTATQLMQGTVKQKNAAASVGDGWIASDKAEALAMRAAAKYNVEPTALKGFLKLEPASKSVNGQVFYNTRSQHGSYAGLFQMGTAAWADARKVDSSLPDYNASKYDALLNTEAAAAFAASNVAMARKMGYKGPISSGVLYMLHNQGIGTFMNSMKTGKTGPDFGSQSQAAQSVVLAAIQQGRMA